LITNFRLDFAAAYNAAIAEVALNKSEKAARKQQPQDVVASEPKTVACRVSGRRINTVQREIRQ
jgi:hypothetical protein